jgi:hypothetical protein
VETGPPTHGITAVDPYEAPGKASHVIPPCSRLAFLPLTLLLMAGARLPERYANAFTCVFDENPIDAARRQRGTLEGGAERADDLALLRSLGFDRRGRSGGLESVGGRIIAPPGLTILGLPVRFLEINGMIGDLNAMYVTTFDDGVAVDQVVRAARLDMDRDLNRRYGLRHYRRRVGSDPSVDIFLDDRRNGPARLVCHVRSTPD